MPATACRSADRRRSASTGGAIGRSEPAAQESDSLEKSGAAALGDARAQPGAGSPGGGGLGAFRRLGAARKTRAPDVVEKIDTLDELHGDEPLAVVDEQLVEGDEIRMREVGEGAKLALEAKEGLDVAVAQRLQSDGAARLPIERAVDDAEAARSEAAFDLETLRPAELLLGFQSHGCPFFFGSPFRGPEGSSVSQS